MGTPSGGHYFHFAESGDLKKETSTKPVWCDLRGGGPWGITTSEAQREFRRKKDDKVVVWVLFLYYI